MPVLWCVGPAPGINALAMLLLAIDAQVTLCGDIKVACLAASGLGCVGSGLSPATLPCWRGWPVGSCFQNCGLCLNFDGVVVWHIDAVSHHIGELGNFSACYFQYF